MKCAFLTIQAVILYSNHHMRWYVNYVYRYIHYCSELFEKTKKISSKDALN